MCRKWLVPGNTWMEPFCLHMFWRQRRALCLEGRAATIKGMRMMKDSFISLILSQLIILFWLLISCAPVEPGQHFSRTLSSQGSHGMFVFRKAPQKRLTSLLSFYFFVPLSVHARASFSHMHTHSFDLLVCSLLLLLLLGLPPTHQWLCMPSVRCILPAWWCVWCWPWLPWSACCLPWRSPVCLSITWVTTRRERSHPPKTAAMRTTRGILGIFTTRSSHDRN